MSGCCFYLRVFLLAGLLCAGNIALAQRTFRHLSIEEGLPSYSAISITQDKTGFVWIGTTVGICRYDGIRFKVYRHQQNDTTTLSSDYVKTLFTDSKGVMWVGTSIGIDKYDFRNDRFIRTPFNNARLTNVHCIFEDSRKTLWIGTDIGLFHMSGDGKTALQFQGIRGEIVKSICEDSQKRIWVGTDSGLNRLIAKGNKYWISYFSPFKTTDENANRVTAVMADENGLIWLGTQTHGLCSFDPKTQIFQLFSTAEGLVNNNIRCLAKDRNQKLWIGTQEGISVLNPVKRTFENIVHIPQQKQSLSQNSVHALFQDAIGSMWIGTYFGGVNICYAYNTPFSVVQNEGRPNNISNNVISSIIDDGSRNLWIGTEGGGLNYLNTTTHTFSYYKHHPERESSLGSNLIKVLYRDTDGNLWIGTHGGGLNVLNADGKSFTKYHFENSKRMIDEVSSVAEDQSGHLWIAGSIGLRVMRRKGTQLTEIPNFITPSRTIPKYLYKDVQNSIWIAGPTGISRFRAGRLSEIDSTLNVTCLTENKSKELWIGTYGSGVAKFDGHKFKTFTNSFFKSTLILGILFGKGNDLWLSTNKGLVHFFPESNIYRIYTSNDGTSGNEFNFNSFHAADDGYFYFGGYNGFTYFKPETILDNPHKAPLVFTNIKLGNGEATKNFLTGNIALSPQMRLKYDQNTFTLDFALLNYIKSQKNRYLYKLDTYDQSWQETNSGSATYTNLPPGSYRFVVKGANNDGVWSGDQTLHIIIRPPFWLSWWAYCMYFLLISGFIFMVARFFFLRELLKKEDELHQAKLNFFTNASHEIRTHLTLIMVPVERMITEGSGGSFINQQLLQVRSNTNKLLNLVRELMDFRKAETNHLQLSARRRNLIPFLQDIYENFRDTAQAADISMSFVHTDDVVEMNFDDKQLEKVFFNLLANAIKFTPKGGQVQLFAEARKNDVLVRVTDNGRGIAPQYLQKLFTNFFQVADHGLQNTGYGIGLALSKNIVELHHGTISVASTPASDLVDGQTAFTVILPKNAPLAVSDAAFPERSSEPLSYTEIAVEAGKVEPTTRAKNKILVIEDNAALRQLLLETLSSEHIIVTAEDGLMGLKTAFEEIPALIISDVMMPGMDGYTLCKSLKNDERTSHIPVILLTAKSSQNDQVEGLQHGADLYLTKPFSTKILNLSVKNLLAARETTKQKITRELAYLNRPSKVNSDPGGSPQPADSERVFLEKVISIIEEHLEEADFGVDKLAKQVAMSAPILYKKIRALTNMSVNEFIKVHRFKRAAALLLEENLTVGQVSYAVGFDDRKYFSKEFKKYFGVAPSEFGVKAIESPSSVLLQIPE